MSLGSVFSLTNIYEYTFRAYIHAGLLGFWGEWHSHPHNFVPESSKHLVTGWYANAFKTTEIQVRYPFAPAYNAEFGLYDGSFAFHTLDGDANGGVDHPEWYFWPLVEKSSQTDFWKKSVMGGETRPELQQIIFQPDYPAGTYEKQDFVRCVLTTHTTYIFHQDAFVNGGYNGRELDNINHAHVIMGYNFVVSRVGLASSENETTVDVTVTIKQSGRAPFYYPLSLGLDCQELAEPHVLDGVEKLIENGDTKEFVFVGVPATALCLADVSFQLLSPYAMTGRPIKFAQGREGIVSLSLPLPEGVRNDSNTTMAESWGDIGDFTLITREAEADPVDLGTIDSGDLFDLSDVGYDLTVGINTTEETKSVTYRYAGTTHRVSIPPYILGGDVNGVGRGIPYLKSPGNKTIVATAIDGRGDLLGSRTVDFELIETVPPSKPTPSPIPPDDNVHGFNTPDSPNILEEIRPNVKPDQSSQSTSVMIASITTAVVIFLMGLMVVCYVRRRRRNGYSLPCVSATRPGSEKQEESPIDHFAQIAAMLEADPSSKSEPGFSCGDDIEEEATELSEGTSTLQ